MFDADLAALCIADEAAGEPYAGKVAIGLVLRKRMAGRFRSDGTVAGTVLAKLQFSGFWCDMQEGHYFQVCADLSQAQARADVLLKQFQAQRLTWRACQSAWMDSDPAENYQGGPEYRKLIAEPRALLYCNLAISQPPWATPDAQVAAIGHHTFFRA